MLTYLVEHNFTQGILLLTQVPAILANDSVAAEVAVPYFIMVPLLVSAGSVALSPVHTTPQQRSERLVSHSASKVRAVHRVIPSELPSQQTLPAGAYV